MSLRIVFMGTPDYARQSLRALIKNGYQVAGVFTQPDKPKGRGGKVTMPPCKEEALRHDIPVYQVRSIRKEGVETLKALAPDLCVTAAFGQILSQEILDIPRLGTVNVHASLLPKYRGSSPVAWCLLNGESETGVTTMMTDKGIDTGDMLLKAVLPIEAEDTAATLTDKLADAGAALLIDTLKALEQGTLTPQKQNEADATYYPMLTKDMGALDFGKTSAQLVNQVRGLTPWPGTFTASPHGVLKVLRMEAADYAGVEAAGTVVAADKKQGLIVKTLDGAVRLTTIQAQGGKAMPDTAYLLGHPLQAGQKMEN